MICLACQLHRQTDTHTHMHSSRTTFLTCIQINIPQTTLTYTSTQTTIHIHQTHTFRQTTQTHTTQRSAWCIPLGLHSSASHRACRRGYAGQRQAERRKHPSFFPKQKHASGFPSSLSLLEARSKTAEKPGSLSSGPVS